MIQFCLQLKNKILFVGLLTKFSLFDFLTVKSSAVFLQKAIQIIITKRITSNCIQRMGNQNPNPQLVTENMIRFYSYSQHPILGQVPVYSIINSGKFVMKIRSTHKSLRKQLSSEKKSKGSKPQRRLSLNSKQKKERQHIFGQVMEQNCEYLLKFFNEGSSNGFTSNSLYCLDGQVNSMTEKKSTLQEETATTQSNKNLSKKPYTIYSSSANFCTVTPSFPQLPSIIESRTRNQLWEYLNYDLAKAYEEQQLQLATIKQVLLGVAKASITLQKYGLFLNLNLKAIQFASGMMPQAYWCDIELDHSHRPYYQYMSLCQSKKAQKIEYIESFYAPEQLLLMKKRISNDCLDLQKCVVYSLGMIILQCVCGKKSQELYLPDRLQIDIREKRSRILGIELKKQEKKMKNLIMGMLEITPRKRYSFFKIVSELEK